MAKTTCPITRQQFSDNAKPLSLVIEGQNIPLSPKQFSTNSFGWNAMGKIQVMVDGVPCTVQVGLNLTIVGSKELPLDPAS